MSKYEESNLILKLYELRREETLRKARDWYFRDFHPESMSDVRSAFFGEQGGYVRMVLSYWDMAAALVNFNAIGIDLFTETNGEHFFVFAKVEPFIGEVRAAFGPRFVMNLEKLIDATPGGRERTAGTRESMKEMRARSLAKTNES